MALKEEMEFAISGKQRASDRKKTSAVSGMRVMIVHQNRHRKPRHHLSRQLQEVEVRREKGASEAEASLRNSIDSRVNTS